MYKDVVIKFLKRQPINDADLNEFITTYIKSKKNINITGQQLMAVKQLIFQGIFKLDSAIKEAAEELNLQTVTLLSKEGQILKVDIYDDTYVVGQ